MSALLELPGFALDSLGVSNERFSEKITRFEAVDT